MSNPFEVPEWQYNAHTGCVVEKTDTPRVICNLSGCTSDEKAARNGRLLAAAPELLDYCLRLQKLREAYFRGEVEGWERVVDSFVVQTAGLSESLQKIAGETP